MHGALHARLNKLEEPAGLEAVGIVLQLRPLDGELLLGGGAGKALDGLGKHQLIAAYPRCLGEKPHIGRIAHVDAHALAVGGLREAVLLMLVHARRDEGDAVYRKAHAGKVHPAEEEPRGLFVQEHPVVHHVVGLNVIAAQEGQGMEVEEAAAHGEDLHLAAAPAVCDFDGAGGAPGVVKKPRLALHVVGGVLELFRHVVAKGVELVERELLVAGHEEGEL